MRQSLKNSFQSQKVINWTQHMNKKLLSLKKVSLHGNFTHFRYEVKTPPEQIVLPVKKNLKKTNTPLRIVKKTAPQNNLNSLNC